MDSKLIDPGFDKIPADELTGEELQARLHAPLRHGLSINDTIAEAANHSVGARGVGTSAVEAGPDLDKNLSETVKTPEELLDLDQ
jgi:hypothetical protein